jgi:hypothetical protein
MKPMTLRSKSLHTLLAADGAIAYSPPRDRAAGTRCISALAGINWRAPRYALIAGLAAGMLATLPFGLIAPPDGHAESRVSASSLRAAPVGPP